MTKDQIDEIAIRVWNESESECDVRTGKVIITEFTHALLAELAKVQEPVSKSGKHHAEIRKVLQYFNLPLDGVLEADLIYAIIDSCGPLFTQPLPRPDLVAEIERLKQRHEASDGITKMQISKLRQQLREIETSLGYFNSLHVPEQINMYKETIAQQAAVIEQMLEACCKVVDAHYDECEPWLDSEMLRAEWKKYL